MEGNGRLHLFCLGVCALSLVGCGPKPTIQISYDRPAQVQIDPSIRQIGIAEFGGGTAEEKRWGEIASDRLAAELDRENRQFGRYQLVDRKRLKAILDEQDLQAAFTDSAAAVSAGKLAHVDAMIYGTVKIAARDERIQRTAFDPMSQRTKQVTGTRRYVLAAVNFTIDNVQTGATLASETFTREFDSEAEQSGGRKAAGMVGFSSGDDLPPTDQITGDLIDECVQAFLAKISPHTVHVSEKLRGSRNKVLQTANKIADAGDYAEALELYQEVLQSDPDCHEAMFNAGVMLEARQQFAAAEAMYDRAFRTKPEEQYVLARQRVRKELGR